MNECVDSFSLQYIYEMHRTNKRSMKRAGRRTKRRSMKSRSKTYKNRYVNKIVRDVHAAEGQQSLARFGHTGDDKFKEEAREATWLQQGYSGSPLSKLINKKFYKYQQKKPKGLKHLKHTMYPNK